MVLFLHFFLGLVTSFLGTVPPSMLNMTAAKISLEQGKTNSIKYALGVSFVVLIQAYIAVLFTTYLRSNPEFVASLQKIALVIFALLSFYFYRQYNKNKIESSETIKNNHKNSFLIGLLLSAMNMFAIPFYCGITTAFDVSGWFDFSQIYIIAFVIGSAIGTFVLLRMYSIFANKIKLNAGGLSKNLNLVLSILTAVLAIVTLIKLI